MKKLIPLFSLLFILFSCEKIELNLSEQNIEYVLTSMVGENINTVGNSLKSEGFQKFKFDDQTNFTKNKEAYLLKTDKKIIVSAGYQLSDSTKSVKLYEEYRNSFSNKQTTGYQAYIYAENFVDFSKSYIDSVKVTSNEYMYIYDDPMKFYVVLQSNMFYLKTASETWYNGDINKDKMWNIQLGEKAKTSVISYSDFAITQ